MYKNLFFIIFLITIWIQTQLATADFLIANGSATEDAWVVYSTWQPADANWPAGFRTKGWSKIEPGRTLNLGVPEGNTFLYIRVEDSEYNEIKPPDHATRNRSSFWIHPTKNFTTVETAAGTFLDSNFDRESLETAILYRYRNGGRYDIAEPTQTDDLSTGQDDLSLAQKVYNRYSTTLLREDLQDLVDQVLTALSDPKTLQDPIVVALGGLGAALDYVLKTPVLIRTVVPDVTDAQIGLLTNDDDIRAILRDSDVRTLFQDAEAVKELKRLLATGTTTCQAKPADLPAKQIYDQAINAVLWIDTDSGHGSGVLIDKERLLAVTNQHVTEDNAWVTVYFPGKDDKGKLVRDMEYYRKNYERLERIRYATKGRVIATNSVNDVAIIQLNQLSPIAEEVNHDFSMQVETCMQHGDKVHILGNPGNRLWNWTQGTYLEASEGCLQKGKGGACLWMEGDAEGGNSGGPILNGQGVLIGILTEGTDDVFALASPLRNIKALLDTVRARHTFRIRNNAGFDLSYYVKWSDDGDWKRHSLDSGRSLYHWWSGEVVPDGYPKIAFDHIMGDSEETWKYYNRDTFLRYFGNNYADHITSDDAEKYVFQYNSQNRRLDLYNDGTAAAPMLSAEPKIPGTEERPKETALLPNYPNPFNPETWIPYQLAESTNVSISIYSADGKLIRILVLGHRPAGTYQSKNRAAYWDGKNDVGEPVANGLYFYTLTAGDFSATRKMLILK